jgi:DNA-binding FadR family transcriptional regulator
MDPPATGRAPTRRAFEEIVVQFEQAIRDGSLRAGDRLPAERELAHAFQVSRTSLREGLRALEAIGVLQARRGQGAGSGSVVEAKHDRLASLLALHIAAAGFPLRDLLELRQDLDALVARAAAQRQAQTDELETLTAAMGRTESEAEFVELECEFHGVIARLSGNAIAPLLLGALRDVLAAQVQELLATSPDPAAARHRLSAQHAEIAGYIQRGDPEAAAAAGADHIRDLASRTAPGAEVPAVD